MVNTVSILGCGWLGTALGKKLLSKKITVKGSTASNENYLKLETTGIDTYHINIDPDNIKVDYLDFFNTDVLVISIPPRRVNNIEEIYPKQIKQVASLIQEMKIPRVIFISSSSVYESKNSVVREDDEGNPEKAAGRALLKAEKLLLDLPGVKTTIIRFGGLIGAQRNPARFLAGKKNVPGKTPVNLIHRDDCINIIIEIIEKEIWGEIFNACAPEHPTKKEFYLKAAEISELPIPDFMDVEASHKIVNSDKLIQRLDYRFLYPSPMDYLRELQEWVYRI